MTTYDDQFIRSQKQPEKATEKAINYLCDLARGRDHEAAVSALPPVWQEQFHAIVANPQGTYAKSDVSKFIDLLKACDKIGNSSRPVPGSAVAANPPTEDGIYMRPNAKVPDMPTFYKVYWNRENTRLLAKEIVLICDATEDSPAISELVYRGQAYRFVTAEMKYNPTLEEAIAFGPKYGRCSQCGRNLNDELSVQLGIGPVCGDRDFGDAFKVMKKMAKAQLAGQAADGDVQQMSKEEMLAELAKIDEEIASV